MHAQHKLVVALDFPDRAAALAMVDALGGAVLWYKVGLELYLAEGAEIVRELRGRGKRVFLDLKLHDIPNTVAAAVRVAAQSGAELLTVHALGGPAMLQAAVAAAKASGSVRLLAVTVLTSMTAADLTAVGVAAAPSDEVLLLGRGALSAGVSGLVCSPLETIALRREHGIGPLLVVPGIRDAADAVGDQQRIATAAEAIAAGASMLVVGRPITRASHPAETAAGLLRSIDAAAV